MSPPPKSPARRLPAVPAMPPPATGKKIAAKPVKNFTVEEWDSSGSGEKVLIYAESGLGKTTLACTAPTPVFIGIDDGGRRVVNPITGKKLQRIPQVECFQDVRDILHSPDLLALYQSIVFDTTTAMQPWAEDYVMENYPMSKGGRAMNLRAYGWNEGYGHLTDVMRLILQDCDALVKQGKNIIMLAQLSAPSKANASGEDYLQEGPDLHHDKRYSVRNRYKEWADHVFKIDYLATEVTDGKVTGNSTRAIFTQNEPHYIAKTRTLENGKVLGNPISFESPADTSLWQFMFGPNS